MASYVTIELDTTPPTLNIFAPSYTTLEMDNEITIECSEDTVSYEIYAMDVRDNRVDYVFNRVSPNILRGTVNFGNFSLGVIRLYARAWDDVGNVSNLEVKAIAIKESLTGLTLQLKAVGMKIDTKIRTPGMQIGIKVPNIETKVLPWR